MLDRIMDLRQVKGIIFTCILLLTGTCAAGDMEKFTHLKDITKAFIVNNISLTQDETLEVNINQDNAPTNIPLCSKEVEAAFPKNSNHEQVTAIELSCKGDKPWHVYMPVDVQVFTKVVVAKRAIVPKEIISDVDLDFATLSKNRLYSGYFKTKEEVVGNTASHTIPSGAVLTKRNIQLPVIVHKNQIVTITARRNNISVSMQGIAKTDGSLNTVIQVYNPSSKRTLDAVVVGPNKADVIA